MIMSNEQRQWLADGDCFKEFANHIQRCLKMTTWILLNHSIEMF